MKRLGRYIIKKLSKKPVKLPFEFDPENFNKMQFDQVYLYKYALMLACQRIEELEKKDPFQSIWNRMVENAGFEIFKRFDTEKEE